MRINVQQCRGVVDGQRCYKPYPHYGPCEALKSVTPWTCCEFCGGDLPCYNCEKDEPTGGSDGDT